MKSKKIISIGLMLSFVLSSIAPIACFADNSNSYNSTLQNDKISEENDVYKQELSENLDIEGVNYTYKYYYDDNNNRCISITNNSNNKTDIITYNETDSKIYENNKEMATVSETKDDSITTESKNARSRSSWRLMNGPVHKYISWKKGATTAFIAGSIAAVLGFKTQAVITAVGFTALSILSGCAIGGTVHFSKYYRYLAFGQTQYRTDWSFVASTGERYGTYTYLSTPM